VLVVLVLVMEFQAITLYFLQLPQLAVVLALKLAMSHITAVLAVGLITITLVV
jgi:hypothetical protein